MEEPKKICKTCKYARLMGYNQVICKKTSEWTVERYSCPRWEGNSKKGEDDEKLVN